MPATRTNDGRLDISDTIRILNWLFLNGAEPPAPGPVDAGRSIRPTTSSPCESTGCPQ
jgi:hypothetical protein